jgi:hypothetical protein
MAQIPTFSILSPVDTKQPLIDAFIQAQCPSSKLLLLSDVITLGLPVAYTTVPVHTVLRIYGGPG